MAPDRLPLQQQQRASTSQSFTLSAALNLPLSSHGPQHAPSLTRGMVGPHIGTWIGSRTRLEASRYSARSGLAVDGQRRRAFSPSRNGRPDIDSLRHRESCTDNCLFPRTGLPDLSVAKGEYKRRRSHFHQAKCRLPAHSKRSRIDEPATVVDATKR